MYDAWRGTRSLADLCKNHLLQLPWKTQYPNVLIQESERTLGHSDFPGDSNSPSAVLSYKVKGNFTFLSDPTVREARGRLKSV